MIKGWFNPQLEPETVFAKYCATGKAQYLKMLVQQFNHPLYHYLVTQSDVATAQDALQQTWLKVIENRHKQASHKQVKSWLFTIARNTLIDELRRQRRWQTIELDTEHLVTNSLEHVLAESDQLQLFNDTLAQLPFYQREAFVFQQEGFSVAEICQLTQANFETVKSRLRYARNTFKTVFGEQ